MHSYNSCSTSIFSSFLFELTNVVFKIALLQKIQILFLDKKKVPSYIKIDECLYLLMAKNVHKRLIILSKLCYCYVYDSSVLVAQWTRARGYEPRCRGFESLLAQDFLTYI